MFGQHGKMGGVSSFEVLKQLGDLPWISSMIPPSEARNATCDSTKMKREVKFQPTKTFHPPPTKNRQIQFMENLCSFFGVKCLLLKLGFLQVFVFLEGVGASISNCWENPTFLTV